MKYVSWDLGNVVLPDIDFDTVLVKLALLLGVSIDALVDFFGRHSPETGRLLTFTQLPPPRNKLDFLSAPRRICGEFCIRLILFFA